MSERAFALVIEGLNNLASLDDLDERIVKSARIAVNDAAERGRTAFARQIRREVNLPANYVQPGGKRLYVSQKATNSTLEAVVTARARATSLARFATDSSSLKKRGAGQRVEVKPGTVRTLPGAFLIRLRRGSELTDTKYNLGMAVRTRDGRPPPGYKPTKLSNGLWLLYGPSVASILHSETNSGGVAADLAPEVARRLEDEFWRQMEL